MQEPYTFVIYPSCEPLYQFTQISSAVIIMDFLEKKNHNLLQRLRYLQLEQCCLHIDQQIGLWLQHQVNPRPQQTATEEPSQEQLHSQPIVTVTATTATAATTTKQEPQPLESLPTPSSTLLSSPQRLPQLEPQLQAQLQTQPQSQAQPPSSSSSTSSTPPPQQQQQPPPPPPPLLLLPPPPTPSPTLLAPPQAHTTSLSPPPPLSVSLEQQQSSPPPSSSSPSSQHQPTQQLPPPHLLPQSLELQQQSKLDDADDKAIGCFLSNIKHLESFDSDATESTSSNDSYDELEGFSHEDIPPKRTNNYYYSQCSPTDPNDLKKKAIWRWANERSRLASRWTWLQAQVADLEFRIRGLNDATMHARAYKMPPLPQILPEHSCSRTVPISKDFGKRRLIKSSQILSDSNKKLVKFSHVPCVCSSLPQTVAPCLSCNGRYNYLRQLDGENAPISERISLLDPCCHPVLSFPEDLTLGSQISYLLKRETINRKPAKGRPGRKKGSTAANLAAAAAAKLANGENIKGRKRKYYHPGMVGRPPGSRSGLKNQSQTVITSNKLRRKYQKHSKANNYDPNWAGSNNRAHATRHKKRVRRTSSINESSVCSESSNHFRPNNSGNPNSAQNVTRRRRSEQSAYDINNIVIPFSIAATTRVEILEYKEIMTPSWRVWENGSCQNDSIEEETEDTSDEAYILRHAKGESEEKKRFSLKPPKNTVAQKIGQMFVNDINM